MVKENEDLMMYFPNLNASQLPEKEFMYGILSTLRPDAIREIIANLLKNRSPNEQEDKGDLVEICEELKESILSLFSMKSR